MISREKHASGDLKLESGELITQASPSPEKAVEQIILWTKGATAPSFAEQDGDMTLLLTDTKVPTLIPTEKSKPVDDDPIDHIVATVPDGEEGDAVLQDFIQFVSKKAEHPTLPRTRGPFTVFRQVAGDIMHKLRPTRSYSPRQGHGD